MHVYHYAPYEKSALLRLAGRHGVGEEGVDGLLRDGVLVDLYPIVRAALRAGGSSYSIKKLEPLYMPARQGEVLDAGASIVAYADYCDLRDAERTEEAAKLLDSIASYNEDDCVSTWRLRNWLLDRAAEHGIATTGITHEEATLPLEPHPAEVTLWEFAGEAKGERTDDQQAAALMAASLGYHRRERKPFWWAHFDRLSNPVDEWADTRDTLVATSVEVEDDWHLPPRKRKARRHLVVTGDFDTGSTVRAGDSVFLLYEAPAPDGLPDGGPWTRAWSGGKILERRSGSDFHDVLVIEELLQTDEEYSALPMAITPGSRSGRSVSRRRSNRRRAPCARHCRICRARPVSTSCEGPRHARVPARSLWSATAGSPPRSPLPSSTSTTRTSPCRAHPAPGRRTRSRVVAALVREHGWRVGVVAQSHSVVENMLDGIVKAGVPGELVAKAKARTDEPTWTPAKDTKA